MIRDYLDEMLKSLVKKKSVPRKMQLERTYTTTILL